MAKSRRTILNDPALVQAFRRAAKLAAYMEKMRKEGYEVLVRKDGKIYKINIP